MVSYLRSLSPLETMLAHDPQYRSLCMARGQTHQAVVLATQDPARFEVEKVKRLQAAERVALEALETFLRQQAAAHPDLEPPSWIRKADRSSLNTSSASASPPTPTSD